MGFRPSPVSLLELSRKVPFASEDVNSAHRLRSKASSDAESEPRVG
jgi:hypothetical protein